MEDEVVCLDSSILIDYFRKKNKKNTFFYQLANRYSTFSVSIITEFEILCGSTPDQHSFWKEFFQNVEILPFDDKPNREAVKIFRELKKEGNLIDIPDLFIGATARAHDLKLATLNTRDFSRISGLEIITKGE